MKAPKTVPAIAHPSVLDRVFDCLPDEFRAVGAGVGDDEFAVLQLPLDLPVRERPVDRIVFFALPVPACHVVLLLWQKLSA